MRYKEDWDQIQKKYLEYWNLENHDRPLVTIRGTRDDVKRRHVAPPSPVLKECWTDTAFVIDANRSYFESTFFGGEAYPVMWPNLGPDIFGAFYGADIEFGTDTSWAHPVLRDWNAAGDFIFDPENHWWRKIVSMTEAMVADCRGDYFVGITDLHPGCDGLVSLRGPEELAMDLYDNPEAVKKASAQFFEGFRTVLDELYRITKAVQTGSTNWLGVWHPGKWYVTSCDFIGMLSGDMYKEFVEGEIRAELDILDASIFHLDGPGALRHLDALLELPDLNGVQWCYGAGQPTARHWLPVLKKIQASGKTIHVSAAPDDLDALMSELKPEGLLLDISPCPNDMTARSFTENEARDILRKVEGWKRTRLF